MNSRVFIPFRIIFIVFLHFPFFLRSCNRSLPGELMLWMMFSRAVGTFLVLFFHPLPTAPSTPWWFSFLFFSFFVVVCLVGGGGHMDVGGQLSPMKLLSFCAGSRSASPLVDFIQDGSRFGFCRTLWENGHGSHSPQTLHLHFIFLMFIADPNTVRPPSSLHPISLRQFRRVLSVASFFRQFPLIANADFQKCLENEHITFISSFFFPLNRSKDPPTPTSQSTLLRMVRNSELCMFSVPRTDVSSVLVFDE